MPEFSIIVPVFNTEKYLRQCLDSVLVQTFTDYECIMVNDGSTDNSVEIAQEYCSIDNRFKLIQKDNGGASAARNKGIMAAKGEYLFFLDSDDFVLPYALEDLHKLTKNKPDIVACESYGYNEAEESLVERKYTLPSTQLPAAQAFSELKILCAPWEFVVNKSFLLTRHIFFAEGIRHEDELWVPLIFLQSRTRENDTHPFYCNRCDTENSVTQRKDIKKLFDRDFVIDELLKFGYGHEEEVQIVLKERCAKILTGMILQRNCYCDVPSVHDLDELIAKKLYLLKFPKGVRYWFLYCLVKILGVKTSSRLLSIRT